MFRIYYALSVADQYIKTGMYKNVLVIGSEVHSTGLDMTSRGRVSVILEMEQEQPF
jgi:3-oxoacyl-[acyl-carrier-protein] synthase-3